jgi:hypothetical protein
MRAFRFSMDMTSETTYNYIKLLRSRYAFAQSLLVSTK